MFSFLKKKKLVTHDSRFHADDVFAYAIFQEVLTKRGEGWSLERSRDRGVIDAADIVFDVGEIYDPNTNRYDHHQRGRAGARPNGILYAAAGLVWKHFGRELCSNDAVWQMIDRGTIQELDAVDNGQDFIGPLLFPDAGYTSLAIHTVNFQPDMFGERSAKELRTAFEQAATFARGILQRAIKSCESFETAYAEVSAVYHARGDKQILIFQKNYGRPLWKRLAEFSEPVFVVYPTSDGSGWKVECVPVTPITMESRKLFPEPWRGLRDAELVAATSTSDITFCHPAGFLLGTKSFESALALANKALAA